MKNVPTSLFSEGKKRRFKQAIQNTVLSSYQFKIINKTKCSTYTYPLKSTWANISHIHS